MTLFRILIVLVFSVSLFNGCNKPEKPLPPGQPILQQPLKIHSVELPHQALPHWRTESRDKPALVLLSADSLLQPVPEQLRQKSRQLALSGTAAELIQHGPLRAETLLLPGQTLSAALDAGLFSRVVWVLPQHSPEERIDVNATRQSLFGAGAIDDYEAQSFEATKRGLKGRIKDVPFEIVLFSKLPDINLDVPAVVHLDLTFFTSLYVNEIKTPLFPLITNNLMELRNSGLTVLDVSFSHDSLIGETPLDLRFIGDVLGALFANPGLLDSPAPRHWALRAKARYLETFFQPEKMLDIYRQILASKPKAPSIHYAIYQTLKLDKKTDEAMASLALAAANDPVYGREYMLLAADAYRKGDVKGSVDLYSRAVDIFPDDPTVKVNLAKALVEASKPSQARKLITELRKLNWTEAYYPGMRDYLKNLLPRE